ncbi:MAG: hypothetical protein HZB56_14765 [Deltaproteobacteria bacterium]|nr:hypothetical protein [Deltaproteobacteria bacterium]
MSLDITNGEWLLELVEEELAASRPAAPPAPAVPESVPGSLEGRARRLAEASLAGGEPPPPGARPFFLARARGHLRVILEVAGMAGAPADPVRRRAELAAILAALAGELPQALAADPGTPPRGSEVAVRRALAAAGYTFAESGWPPGDPAGGIPLSCGQLWVERLLAARVAARYYRAGRLEEDDVRRRLLQAARDMAFLVELLVAQTAVDGPLDARRRKVVRHQVLRLHLPRDLERALREALRNPRGPEEILASAPRRLRAFLLDQALLADLAAEQAPSPARAAFAERLGALTGCDAGAVAARRAAMAPRAVLHRWQDGPDEWVPGEFQGLPAEWGDVADELVHKVSGLFEDNLDAIVREVKQAGELGQLLARAASGTQLSAEERRKVKAQLIDLARVVPALAIFAAPGGMLLLPLLAKLLPFRVLPSAWDPKEARTSTPPRGTPVPKKGGGPGA